MIRRRFALALLLRMLVCMGLTPCCFANRNADIPQFSPPVQNYAVIDLSGDKSSSVKFIALNDDNHAAFGFTTGQYPTDPNGTISYKFHSYTWENGSLGNEHIIDLVTDGGAYDDGKGLKGESWSGKSVTTLLSNGQACGVGGTTVYANDEHGNKSFDVGSIDLSKGLFGVSNPQLPAPFDSPNGEVYDILLDPVSENDAFMCHISFDDANVYLFFGPDGKWTIFPNGHPIDMTKVAPGVGVQNASVYEPAAINVNGWFVAGTGGIAETGVMWKGMPPIELLPSGSIGSDLNDQNQIVMKDYTPFGGIYNSGSLWENEVVTTFSDTLPYWIAWQYFGIQPNSISNQVKAAPADGSTSPDTDKTINILADADGVDVGAYGKTVWTRDNAGQWTFANIALPEDTTITDWTSINSSGVIAAIGNGGHALLLVPDPLTVSNIAPGSWDGTNLVGYQYKAKALVPDTGAISQGGIWRDVQATDIITFKDGSTLICASGWLSDTPSRKLPGKADGARNLAWDDGDRPSIPGNAARGEINDIETIKEFFNARWFAVFQVSGQQQVVDEADTSYINIGFWDSTGATPVFRWNSQASKSTPAFGLSITGGTPRFQPISDRNPSEFQSNSNAYFNKNSNWKASNGLAKKYQPYYGH